MIVLEASEIKRHGVSAIANALRDDDEAAITVRGKQRYMVVTSEHFQKLREYELEAAVVEARADIAAGRAKACSIAEHLAEVTDGV